MIEAHEKMCALIACLVVSICVFLHDVLAMHLLIELKVRLNDEGDVKKFETESNRSNLLLLMDACG